MALNGGDRVADVLARRGVPVLFTLCGGHISPILVSAKRRGIRIVDVRQEVTAVFAADAVSRLTGVPGVAAVTAGPGVTNAVTALQNARLAQSPLVLLGGATATVLKGRGALQDIDQMTLLSPVVKWATRVEKVRDLAPALDRAFVEAQASVPGPVFVECPVDLLYEEKVVRSWYEGKGGGAKDFKGRIQKWYLGRHLDSMFEGAGEPLPPEPPSPEAPAPAAGTVGTAALLVRRAKKPLLLVGSQALLDPKGAGELARAVGSLGLPVYLSGMARGLLGPSHAMQMRHHRKEALREADLVILAGAPCDFRLDYGRQISGDAILISVNRNEADLTLNRRPALGILAAPERFLLALARELAGEAPRASWLETLRARDAAREAEVAGPPAGESGALDPLFVCRRIEEALAPDSVLVADGGDFVATASYIVRPRGPLSWLDPGVFGTLGVGAGFALAAKVCRPTADVVLLYGDGSAGYSLVEIDTFVRHGLGMVAIVGNDGGWTQIAREQIDILKDDTGTVLRKTDYHRVAEGLGGEGILLREPDEVAPGLQKALELARRGRPVLVNVLLGKTAFRKGSISM